MPMGTEQRKRGRHVSDRFHGPAVADTAFQRENDCWSNAKTPCLKTLLHEHFVRLIALLVLLAGKWLERKVAHPGAAAFAEELLSARGFLDTDNP